MRQYLALAIGRLDPPLPPRRGRRPDRRRSTIGRRRSRAISAIWALGSSGDPAVVPTLQPLYASPDAGIRKMVVYALGALPGDAQIATLRTALQDADAGRALERRGRAGAPRQPRRRAGAAADARPAVRRADVKRDVRQDEDQDPIADVMISGLRAAATLKDDALKPSVTTLSQQDRSMKVRQAALEALKVMG